MSRDIRDSFPSKYVKASDLKGRDVSVTIDKVEYESVGSDREMKPVVYFVGKDKGMVLNKTNCNAIIQLTQTPDPDEWRGVQITIYPTETSFGGEQVECVRVRQDSVAKRRARMSIGNTNIEPLPRELQQRVERELDRQDRERVVESHHREPGDDDERASRADERASLTDDDIPF